MLEGKKVLLIMPSVFGYEDDIKRELIGLGAKVDYFDERPFSSSISKILNRVNIKIFIRKKIDNYYNWILECCTKKKYDYLFVISPETLDVGFMDKIKTTNCKMLTILYMWDSLRNKPNAKKLLPQFDRIYSFDPKDLNFSDNIRFLPLFYNNDFRTVESYTNKEIKYAVSFIGTVHSDRVRLVKKILKHYENSGFETFSFFYCPSKLLFILKKLFTRELDKISYSEVSFKSISKVQIKDVVLKSNAIIDIHHPEQNGLTMRSLESLGLNKKLITTNASIKGYDFYSSNNIAIIDRHSPVISDKIMTSQYSVPNADIVNQYSLHNWLKNIFNKD